MSEEESQIQTMSSEEDISYDSDSSGEDSGSETMSSGTDDDNSNSNPLEKKSQPTSPKDPYAGVQARSWVKGFVIDAEKLSEIDPQPHLPSPAVARFSTLFTPLGFFDRKWYPIKLISDGDDVHEILIKAKGFTREELEKRPISPLQGRVGYWFKEATLPVLPIYGSTKENSRKKDD